ncbi:CoaD Phosphopantetheine adenylyltransferase [uncultured Caudovirales phage]|uniref:Phosphopantetheine adenylyltransferase n=1 Tax=uncultured Caudovirales phage TaxID=2100421 RepID=A0A6J5RRA9_9CAUD|nr:CoaD Phosphopantetheine adenylyltransferase [uncultured Caudovirales phage]
MLKAIYAGSFDPISLGHIDIINRSLKICDRLIVAVGINPDKKSTLSFIDRLNLIDKSLDSADYKNVSIESFKGLLVDFAKNNNASILIRGIRSVSDFEYEINLANVNKTLAPDIETVFLPTKPELAVISSSMIKEIAKHDGDISKFVTPCVNKAIKQIYHSDLL